MHHHKDNYYLDKEKNLDSNANISKESRISERTTGYTSRTATDSKRTITNPKGTRIFTKIKAEHLLVKINTSEIPL
jgi:hypothetical protein